MDVLVKDLKVFSSFNEDLFKEITQLLTLDNFRYFELDVIFGFELPALFEREIEMFVIYYVLLTCICYL